MDNLAAAIPAPGDKPIGIQAIVNRAAKPRPSARQCGKLIKWLVEFGFVEEVKAGLHTKYRRSPEWPGIDSNSEVPYTTTGRSESSVIPDNPFVRALRKLKDDQCVTLWMPKPKNTLFKKSQEDSRTLVTITPGPLLGLPKYVVMISIIGSGCRLVRLDKANQVANLVLAGMPAKLANALMEAFHQAFKE